VATGQIEQEGQGIEKVVPMARQGLQLYLEER
jgi:hypothetical protein